MIIRQRLTTTGRNGVVLFCLGALASYGGQQWMQHYLQSLRGTGITQMPSLDWFYALIYVGAAMLVASIPMMTIGREFPIEKPPQDNGLWR